MPPLLPERIGSWNVEHLVRARGPLSVFAGERNGESALVLRPSGDTPGELAHSTLHQVAAAHRAVGGGAIPALIEHADVRDDPFLALSTKATIDLEEVLGVLADTGNRVPHRAAVVIIDGLFDAFVALHEACHARDEKPDVAPMGALSPSNVVLGEDGSVALLGIGYPFPTRTPLGAPALVPELHQAPEVAFGAPATPAADVHALLSLWRALSRYAQVSDALASGMGVGDRSDPSVLEKVLTLQARALDPLPEKRFSMAELRTAMHDVRRRIGAEADLALYRDVFGTIVASLAQERRVHRRAAPPRPLLTLTADGCHVTLGPVEVDLSRRGAMRRILLALAAARQDGGRALDWQALLEAGWPGQRVSPESGRSRVYVAVHGLRKLGLSDAVLRRDEGYVLSPRLELRFAE